MQCSDGRQHVFLLQYDNQYFWSWYCDIDIDIDRLFGLWFFSIIYLLQKLLVLHSCCMNHMMQSFYQLAKTKQLFLFLLSFDSTIPRPPPLLCSALLHKNSYIFQYFLKNDRFKVLLWLGIDISTKISTCTSLMQWCSVVMLWCSAGLGR